MPLKLKRGTEGIWYDYQDGWKFKIRPIQPKEYLNIREKAKNKVMVTGSDNKPEYVDNYNEAEIMYQCFQYTLAEYSLESETGMTDAEVREAIFNKIELRDWISSKAEELRIKENASLEGELKNSDSSQSGLARKGTKNAQTAGKSTAE